MSGAVASAITHTLVQPIDQRRTREVMRQRRSLSAPGAVGHLYTRGGARRVLLRNGTTFVGRVLYGASLYPGFQLTKLWLAGRVGVLYAVRFRLPLVWLSSAWASAFSIVNLLPFDALRSRMIGDPYYCDTMAAGFGRLVREEGVEALYSDYPGALLRTFAFNGAKFIVYDYFDDAVTLLWPGLLPGLGGTRALLSLVKGCIAGISGVCASYPVAQCFEQSVASRRQHAPVSVFGAGLRILREKGPEGLYEGSLPVFAWASVVSLEFFLYDFVKELVAAHVVQ